MAVDPRTPVVVGGGQVNERSGGVEPVDLIVTAARTAEEDAGARALLAAVDSVRLVRMLSWRYRDPGALVGERIGASPKHTGYTGNGGNGPQALVNGAATDIAAGRCDVVLIGGAESWRTRMGARVKGERPPWTKQGESVAKAEKLVAEVPLSGEAETRAGLDRPTSVYPLFEEALRIATGRSRARHSLELGELWARFSRVAADNPNAWSRRTYSAAELVTPSEQNRRVTLQYPKLLNSNNNVEQGAALLVCSAEAATRLGVPKDRWVFPQSGVEAHDTYAVAERGALDESPAIRVAGRRALELSGIGVDEVAHVDVYSCFPSAVQVAATELGLPIADPERPLTVTGGLTFAGGPWNNYSTHAIATMLSRLRSSPGDYGLVTANGGYLTKHAFGVYRTEPPAEGFRWADVQQEVDKYPTTRALTSYEGPARVESWTATYARGGEPERGYASVRTPSGERTYATVTETGTLERMVDDDIGDAEVTVDSDGAFRFDEE